MGSCTLSICHFQKGFRMCREEALSWTLLLPPTVLAGDSACPALRTCVGPQDWEGMVATCGLLQEPGELVWPVCAPSCPQKLHETIRADKVAPSSLKFLCVEKRKSPWSNSLCLILGVFLESLCLSLKRRQVVARCTYSCKCLKKGKTIVPIFFLTHPLS